MKLKHNKGYQSLQTIRKIGQLHSIGAKFCNGISNKYSEHIPNFLKQILSVKQIEKFSTYMKQLNFKVSQYWPCSFAYWCGILSVPCTLGLSLCIPSICVSEAEAVLRQQIKKINQDILNNKKLEMKLHKQCCESRLIIQQIDFSMFQISQDSL